MPPPSQCPVENKDHSVVGSLPLGPCQHAPWLAAAAGLSAQAETGRRVHVSARADTQVCSQACVCSAEDPCLKCISSQLEFPIHLPCAGPLQARKRQGSGTAVAMHPSLGPMVDQVCPTHSPGLGFGVWGLGFGVYGLESGIQGRSGALSVYAICWSTQASSSPTTDLDCHNDPMASPAAVSRWQQLCLAFCSIAQGGGQATPAADAAAMVWDAWLLGSRVGGSPCCLHGPHVPCPACATRSHLLACPETSLLRDQLRN